MMKTTIGKKIHTLVKENTPLCHKIRQECGFTQKVAFYHISLCFLPHCCANIGREVTLVLPNTHLGQEIYDTHTCLKFSKTCQNVCLYIYIYISKEQICGNTIAQYRKRIS